MYLETALTILLPIMFNLLTNIETSDLCTFSANFSRLKIRLCHFLRFLDVWILKRISKRFQFLFWICWHLLVFGADEEFLDAPRDCLGPPHHLLLDDDHRHRDVDGDLFIGR